MNIAGLLEGLSTATARDLATLVSGDLEGSGDVEITGVETLLDSSAGDLTFIGDAKHARRWTDAAATVALANRDLDLGDWDDTTRAVVRVDDADQAMIIVLEAIESATQELAFLRRPSRGPNLRCGGAASTT